MLGWGHWRGEGGGVCERRPSGPHVLLTSQCEPYGLRAQVVRCTRVASNRHLSLSAMRYGRSSKGIGKLCERHLRITRACDRDRFDVLSAEEVFAALLDGYAVDQLAP